MARGRRPPLPAPPAPSLIREMPPEERPRQRFLRVGGEVLSNAELLSLVLGSGSQGACSLGLAREVLKERGGLLGLVGVPPEVLFRPGLGEAKAVAVLAAVELALRLAREEVPSRAPLGDPGAVVRYLVLRYTTLGQEVMGALYVDVRNRVIGDREVYRGTISRTSVEPREIFLHALLQGAAHVVLFHTHPSGDPSPSVEDVAFTRRMIAAGEALGVGLLDHLILGSTGRWVSLRDRGVWR